MVKVIGQVLTLKQYSLGAFDEHGRVVIAVTKYDTVYHQRKKRSADDIKRVISEEVRRASGCTIADDSIINVCGEWALNARLLKKNPEDKHCLRVVKIGLEISETPRGEEDSSNRPSAAVCMEEMTNIQKLEDR